MDDHFPTKDVAADKERVKAALAKQNWSEKIFKRLVISDEVASNLVRRINLSFAYAVSQTTSTIHFVTKTCRQYGVPEGLKIRAVRIATFLIFGCANSFTQLSRKISYSPPIIYSIWSLI
jgi:hypothetical protein